MINQGGGLRGPSVVVQGGSLEVQVGTSDSFVTVSYGGSSAVVPHPVGRDGKATIPLPVLPPGTTVVVAAGTGLNAQVLLVEVVAPE